MPTRIKICGLTRASDVDAAVGLGVDAIGLVFYQPSLRYLAPTDAKRLIELLPPFVNAVGLFVNAASQTIDEVLKSAPLSMLQFHGEEKAAECTRWSLPWIKAARITPTFNLVQYAENYAAAGARALLLDAHVEGYGGKGRSFDWSQVPERLPLPVVLAGGLDAENVGEAIGRVRPAAVDVSSGVETSAGIKDADKMRAFVDAVKSADANTQARL